MFSESQGRFVVTVSKKNKEKFEQLLGSDAMLMGRVGGSRFIIKTPKKIINLPLKQIENAYKSTFEGY